VLGRMKKDGRGKCARPARQERRSECVPSHECSAMCGALSSFRRKSVGGRSSPMAGSQPYRYHTAPLVSAAPRIRVRPENAHGAQKIHARADQRRTMTSGRKLNYHTRSLTARRGRARSRHDGDDHDHTPLHVEQEAEKLLLGSESGSAHPYRM